MPDGILSSDDGSSSPASGVAADALQTVLTAPPPRTTRAVSRPRPAGIVTSHAPASFASSLALPAVAYIEPGSARPAAPTPAIEFLSPSAGGGEGDAAIPHSARAAHSGAAPHSLHTHALLLSPPATGTLRRSRPGSASCAATIEGAGLTASASVAAQAVVSSVATPAMPALLSPSSAAAATTSPPLRRTVTASLISSAAAATAALSHAPRLSISGTPRKMSVVGGGAHKGAKLASVAKHLQLNETIRAAATRATQAVAAAHAADSDLPSTADPSGAPVPPMSPSSPSSARPRPSIIGIGGHLMRRSRAAQEREALLAREDADAARAALAREEEDRYAAAAHRRAEYSWRTLLAKEPAEREEDEVLYLLEWVTSLRITFLLALPRELLLTLVRHARLEMFAPDAYVFQQGDAASSFFVVLSGRVGVHVREDEEDEEDAAVAAAANDSGTKRGSMGAKRKQQQQEQTVVAPTPTARKHRRPSERPGALASSAQPLPPGSPAPGFLEVMTLGPGQAFGEVALLQPRQRRSASIRAKEALALLSIDKETYRLALADRALAERNRRAAFVRSHAFFARMSNEKQSMVVTALKERVYARGATIVREGEPIARASAATAVVPSAAGHVGVAASAAGDDHGHAQGQIFFVAEGSVVLKQALRPLQLAREMLASQQPSVTARPLSQGQQAKPTTGRIGSAGRSMPSDTQPRPPSSTGSPIVRPRTPGALAPSSSAAPDNELTEAKAATATPSSPQQHLSSKERRKAAAAAVAAAKVASALSEADSTSSHSTVAPRDRDSFVQSVELARIGPGSFFAEEGVLEPLPAAGATAAANASFCYSVVAGDARVVCYSLDRASFHKAVKGQLLASLHEMAHEKRRIRARRVEQIVRAFVAAGGLGAVRGDTGVTARLVASVESSPGASALISSVNSGSGNGSISIFHRPTRPRPHNVRNFGVVRAPGQVPRVVHDDDENCGDEDFADDDIAASLTPRSRRGSVHQVSDAASAAATSKHSRSLSLLQSAQMRSVAPDRAVASAVKQHRRQVSRGGSASRPASHRRSRSRGRSLSRPGSPDFHAQASPFSASLPAEPTRALEHTHLPQQSPPMLSAATMHALLGRRAADDVAAPLALLTHAHIPLSALSALSPQPLPPQVTMPGADASHALSTLLAEEDIGDLETASPQSASVTSSRAQLVQPRAMASGGVLNTAAYGDSDDAAAVSPEPEAREQLRVAVHCPSTGPAMARTHDDESSSSSSDSDDSCSSDRDEMSADLLSSHSLLRPSPSASASASSLSILDADAAAALAWRLSPRRLSVLSRVLGVGTGQGAGRVTDAETGTVLADQSRATGGSGITGAEAQERAVTLAVQRKHILANLQRSPQPSARGSATGSATSSSAALLEPLSARAGTMTSRGGSLQPTPSRSPMQADTPPRIGEEKQQHEPMLNDSAHTFSSRSSGPLLLGCTVSALTSPRAHATVVSSLHRKDRFASKVGEDVSEPRKSITPDRRHHFTPNHDAEALEAVAIAEAIAAERSALRSRGGVPYIPPRDPAPFSSSQPLPSAPVAGATTAGPAMPAPVRPFSSLSRAGAVSFGAPRLDLAQAQREMRGAAGVTSQLRYSHGSSTDARSSGLQASAKRPSSSHHGVAPAGSASLLPASSVHAIERFLHAQLLDPGASEHAGTAALDAVLTRGGALRGHNASVAPLSIRTLEELATRSTLHARRGSQGVTSGVLDASQKQTSDALSDAGSLRGSISARGAGSREFTASALLPDGPSLQRDALKVEPLVSAKSHRLMLMRARRSHGTPAPIVQQIRAQLDAYSA